MADEIDIEEHDIMENPVIKNKFPDLSVLKKEMCNFYDELETTGLKQQIKLCSDMKPKLVEVCKTTTKPSSSMGHATAPENNHLQSNKIILGSKPNKVTVDQNYFDTWAPYEANIVLQDIKSYLSKSRRYCETCSILFPEPKEFQTHVIKFHSPSAISNNLSITVDKQSELHTCKICSNTFATKHVLKRHINSQHNKEEPGHDGDTTKHTQINTAIVDINKKNNSTDLSNTCFHCKKSFDTQKKLIEHLYDVLQTKKKASEIVPVLKSVLFKCNKCDINFVSSQVAARHNEHMEMLINWKCSICSRIFKKEDELSHERQHAVSNNFILYNLGEIDVNKILFKCMKCSTHFTENIYLYHFRDCSLKKFKSAHCKFCDILLDSDLIASHNSDHKRTGLNVKQLIIIETEVISDNPVKNNPVKNVTKEKVLKNDTSDLLKSFSEVKIVLKRLEKDDLLTYVKLSKEQITASNSSKSTKAPIPTKIPCKPATKKNDGKWAPTRLVMKTMQKNKNICKSDTQKIGISSNIKKSKTSMKMDIINHPLHKSPKLAYSYCEYCKSFITKFKMVAHKQSRCLKIKSRVCKHCGLTFTPTSYMTHGKLHEKNENLKLTNFKFYNLHTGQPMSPPIPEYPKCVACEVHFLTAAARDNHACSEEAYLTCHICETRLSEAAFKLHMMFHHYSGEVNETTSSKYIESDIDMDSNTCNTETATVNCLNIQNSELYKKDDTKPHQHCSDLGEIIYTCRNCRVTVDTYDKVIEHCQGQCNVDGKGTETTLCNTCQLDIDKGLYDAHHNTHNQGQKFTILKFDRYYFPEENYLWVNHIFKSIPKDKLREILSKSIYRYEGRIKMNIIQQGASNLTVYKCDRCNCFIEPTSVFKHADNSCFKLRKHPCSFCGLPYNSSASRADHEEIHRNPGITPKSYRIVLFNQEQDKELNKSFCLRKRYVLYQCRICNGIIDKLEFDGHKCDISNLKKCPDCALLIYNKDFEAHALTHSEFDSFNYKNMKVILLGDVTRGLQRRLKSNFQGNVLDYRMYRCKKCQLCVKNERFIKKHSCYYGRPQSKCPKCNLYFSVSRLKTHMRCHDRDPDYVRSNMTMISFDPSNWDKNENATITTVSGDCELTDSNSDSDCDFVMNEEERSGNIYELPTHEKMDVVEEIAKIYKCICGLHFLNEDSIKRHFGVCKSGTKSSKQECSKCNLLFTSNVLFTHMLAHHSSKNRRYKYEIIDRYDTYLK